jgi:S1-C subfamily serine protease
MKIMSNGSDDFNYEESLRRRIDRALKKDAEAIKKTLNRVRAIVGDQKAIEQDEQANTALEMLREGEVPSPAQLAALEMVVRMMRPAPLFEKGELKPLPQNAAAVFDEWPQFQVEIKPYFRSIGRIDRVSLVELPDPTSNTVGTGFVVSYERDLLVTNKHVLNELSSGSFRLEKGQGVVNFQVEYNTIPEPKPVNIIGVEDVSKTLDIALLKLEKTVSTDGRKAIQFNLEPAADDLPVVAVGYPCNDGRNPLFVNALFGERFGVKRAAPGLIVASNNDFHFHDCSTLGGNSGSPLLSMKDASLVGLHHEGKFTFRNEAIKMSLVKDFLAPHLN